MGEVVIRDQGVVVGNPTDKYGSTNPVYRRLMDSFCACVCGFVDRTGAADIHEVGCGEGHLARMLERPGRRIRASDFSEKIVDMARDLSRPSGSQIEFSVRSIYDLEPGDAAELVLCCEVLEHLDHPESAVKVLAQMARPYLIVSVPREPLWRMMNMARGKYWSRLGNSYGHVNHWSSLGIARLLSSHLDVVEVRRPFPWTVILCKSRGT